MFAIRQFVLEVVVEATLQKKVGQSAEQVFHAHVASGVGDVFGVADAFHKKQLLAFSH
jgi:hypothetical protein